jgi:hypothetical protein
LLKVLPGEPIDHNAHKDENGAGRPAPSVPGALRGLVECVICGTTTKPPLVRSAPMRSRNDRFSLGNCSSGYAAIPRDSGRRARSGPPECRRLQSVEHFRLGRPDEHIVDNMVVPGAHAGGQRRAITLLARTQVRRRQLASDELFFGRQMRSAPTDALLERVLDREDPAFASDDGLTSATHASDSAAASGRLRKWARATSRRMTPGHPRWRCLPRLRRPTVASTQTQTHQCPPCALGVRTGVRADASFVSRLTKHHKTSSGICALAVEVARLASVHLHGAIGHQRRDRARCGQRRSDSRTHHAHAERELAIVRPSCLIEIRRTLPSWTRLLTVSMIWLPAASSPSTLGPSWTCTDQSSFGKHQQYGACELRSTLRSVNARCEAQSSGIGAVQAIEVNTAQTGDSAFELEAPATPAAATYAT